MAKQYFSLFTTYGSQVLANAIAKNQPLRITQMAVGDGNGKTVTPTANQTRLVKEVHRANISAISVDPRNNKQVIFELTLPENVGGFYVREMGIFDSSNKLVAVANCPESFKPTLESGSGKVQVLRMILQVSSSNAVTLTVDDSVIFVTRGQLAPQTITASSTNGFDETGHSHQIDQATTSQKGIVQLSSETNSTAEDRAATPKAVKMAYDKALEAQTHANNANENANNRVLRTGDTMTGLLEIKNDSWGKMKFTSKDASSWWLETAPNSAENARVNLCHVTPATDTTAEIVKNIYFPAITQNETVAYQSWVTSLFVGVPIAFPLTTVPTGFLPMQGQAFNKKTYPLLAERYPSGKLPDLRGEFIRGWDNGRGVDEDRDLLSTQSDEFKAHKHKFINEYNTVVDQFIAYTDKNNERISENNTQNGNRCHTYVGMVSEGGNETRPRNIAFQYICLAA